MLPPITSDRRKLLQILLNLASNAVKFTERGEIRFQCRAASDALQIAVSDTGIGINAKDMDLLFQPFSQIDGGLQKRQQGTGLGLHLSQNLARLLDGVISVESKYGKGSTFTLTLPLVAEAKIV
jgi:signal transduction histidine kinase